MTLRNPLLFLILALLQSWPAFARRDPNLDWQQFATEHFLVVYPASVSGTASQAATIAEQAYPKIKRLCGINPAFRVPIVLNPQYDIANGFAQGLYPKVEVYLADPEGKWSGTLNQSFLEFVLYHELTHLYYGTRAEGFTKVITKIFGQVNTLNFIAPLWWTEGVAEFAETELTSGGRGRSPYHAMELAANLLSDDPWSLGQVSNPPQYTYPFDRYYLAGYDLVAGLYEETRRADFLDRISAQQSAWPFFGMGFAWKRAVKANLGKVFRSQWEALQQEYGKRFGPQRRALAKALQLTQDPLLRFEQPAWTKDGKVVGYCQSTDYQPQLASIQPEQKELQTIFRPALLFGRMSYQPGTQTFYYARLLPDPIYYDSFIADLFAYGPQGERRLTYQARCWSPDMGPDGKMVCIKNLLGMNQLALLDPKTGNLELIPGPRGAVYFSPRWSPDGKQLAAAVRIAGKQDICLIDPHTGQLSALTGWDAAGDFDPAWSPDGQFLFFVSDRTSVHQIYAYHLADKKIFKVTDSQMGVFEPAISLDGKNIAFAEYQIGNSQQAVIAPLTPDTWQPITGLPSAAQPQAPADFFLPGKMGEAYNPWPKLLPSLWMPMVKEAKEGLAWGAMSVQQDTLELQQWSAEAYYQSESQQGYGDLIYTNQSLPVILSAEGFRLPFYRAGLAGNLEDQTQYWGRKVGWELSANLPLVLSARSGGSTVLQSLATYERYQIEGGDLPAFPGENYQGLQGSLAWQSVDQADLDLFPLQGAKISLTGRAALNCKPYDGRLCLFETEVYFPAFFPHQAFILSVKTSHLAGQFPEAILTSAPRGYSGGQFNSSNLTTLSAGYRFPVWYLDKGPGILPVFFHALWAEGFVDWGAGTNDVFSRERWQATAVTSVGLEINLAMQWFWFVPATLKQTLVYKQNHEVQMFLNIFMGI